MYNAIVTLFLVCQLPCFLYSIKKKVFKHLTLFVPPVQPIFTPVMVSFLDESAVSHLERCPVPSGSSCEETRARAPPLQAPIPACAGSCTSPLSPSWNIIRFYLQVLFPPEKIYTNKPLTDYRNLQSDEMLKQAVPQIICHLGKVKCNVSNFRSIYSYKSRNV